MVAGGEAGNARANLLDNAGAFMAGTHWERTGVAAIEVMNIAVAKSARNITNENLMRFWFVDLNVDDLVPTWAFE
jgi:hypothetical protein